jgi:hypothetical protein
MKLFSVCCFMMSLVILIVEAIDIFPIGNFFDYIHINIKADISLTCVYWM